MWLLAMRSLLPSRRSLNDDSVEHFRGTFIQIITNQNNALSQTRGLFQELQMPRPLRKGIEREHVPLGI
jgi:hypothetical protein